MNNLQDPFTLVLVCVSVALVGVAFWVGIREDAT